jgi:mannose-1-phosphate guanylyltransferase
MKSNNYCVIMAGGIGSRFWPISTAEKPKQFLDILGIGKSLIQLTYERFNKIIPNENIIVVTSNDYINFIKEQLPNILPENILTEPMRRNTAPCISYATCRIENMNPNANVVVTPSDHLITNEEAFLKNISDGLDYVNNNEVLLTIGIKPNRPDTGYGYIQIEASETKENTFNRVKTFTEKPNLELAEFFLKSGEFLWNAGLFIWSVKSIDKALREYLPEVHNLFLEGKDYFGTDQESDFIQKVYSECKTISIDFGVMEKARNVFTLSASFGWTDLGTWKSLYENSTKDEGNNVKIGAEKLLLENSFGNIIVLPKDKTAVIKNIEDFIIVDSEDSLLICKIDNEQEIKEIVTELKRRFQ